ncbi:hypothetical protein [Halomonas piscis]|jgi:hypothetical protein|uniref:hypothetical protein n=1 Tax=Halomonas piscis TaxID=3031727 RepID=UPI002627B82B|nr:hypothetical protein [Halomonas piscis]
MPAIVVRVTDAQKAELEARAEGSVSEYVRRQLFNDQPSLEAVLDRIDHLADDIAEGRLSPEPSSFQSPSTTGDQWPLLLEMLLMLRATMKPSTMRSAQAELKRRGVTPWGGE